MDKDGDGYLSRLEIKQILMRQGGTDLERIDDILDELDVDGEGSILITEYANYVIRSKLMRQ